jgi:hypothetical protein
MTSRSIRAGRCTFLKRRGRRLRGRKCTDALAIGVIGDCIAAHANPDRTEAVLTVVNSKQRCLRGLLLAGSELRRHRFLIQLRDNGRCNIVRPIEPSQRLVEHIAQAPRRFWAAL